MLNLIDMDNVKYEVIIPHWLGAEERVKQLQDCGIKHDYFFSFLPPNKYHLKCEEKDLDVIKEFLGKKKRLD